MLEEELDMLRQAVRPSREERRERIATAMMVAVVGSYIWPEYEQCATRAVNATDALLRALGEKP